MGQKKSKRVKQADDVSENDLQDNGSTGSTEEATEPKEDPVKKIFAKYTGGKEDGNITETDLRNKIEEKIKKDWEAEVAKQVKAKLNNFLKEVQGSDELLKNEDGGALANELWKSTSQEVAACHASVAEKEINTRLAQLAQDIGAQGGKIDKIGFEDFKEMIKTSNPFEKLEAAIDLALLKQPREIQRVQTLEE